MNLMLSKVVGMMVIVIHPAGQLNQADATFMNTQTAAVAAAVTITGLIPTGMIITGMIITTMETCLSRTFISVILQLKQTFIYMTQLLL